MDVVNVEKRGFCDKATCVYHEQNMELFKDFKATLHEISTAIQHLDKDMTQQTGGQRVWRIIIGSAVTLTLAIGSYFVSDYKEYKNICKTDLAALTATVMDGMQKRIRLEERMKNLEDDIREVRQVHVRVKP